MLFIIRHINKVLELLAHLKEVLDNTGWGWEREYLEKMDLQKLNKGLA